MKSYINTLRAKIIFLQVRNLSEKITHKQN